MAKNKWIILLVMVGIVIGYKSISLSMKEPSVNISAVNLANKNVNLITAKPHNNDVPVSNELVADKVIENKNIVRVQAEAESEKKSHGFVLCEHIVSGETRDGFTGQIRLINKSKEIVSGWSVSWEYEDGSSILQADNVALSGNNPYTGEYLDWNQDIAPGETVTFDIVGIKGGATAPLHVSVKGDICI